MCAMDRVLRNDLPHIEKRRQLNHLTNHAVTMAAPFEVSTGSLPMRAIFHDSRRFRRRSRIAKVTGSTSPSQNASRRIFSPLASERKTRMGELRQRFESHGIFRPTGRRRAPVDRSIRTRRYILTRLRYRSLRFSLHLLHGGKHDVSAKKGPVDA